MSRNAIVVWLLLALGLGGCGSSDSTVFDSGPIGAVDVLVGRAQANVPMVGATVQTFDLSGRPLLSNVAPVTTLNGQFRTLQSATSDFRVVVTPNRANINSQGERVALAAEVRNFQSTWVGVNYVTNLVSVYMSLHPELTLAQAEANVRTFLEIPEDIDLGSGLDNELWFSHTQFARNAINNGGVVAYTMALAQQVDVGPPQPILGAEAGLVGSLAENVAGNVIAAPLTDGLGNLFGWAVSAAGFNIGGPSMKDISEQLDQIQMQLDALNDLIRQLAVQGAYVDDQNTLETNSVTPIQNASAQVQGLAAMFEPSNPNINTPTTGPDTNTVNVMNTLQGSDWNELSTEILNYQLGRNGLSNMVTLYGALVMDSVGADTTGQYGYPLRSNADIKSVPNSSLWDQKSRQLAFYLQVVNQGINLIAEAAHISVRDFQSNNGYYTSNATSMMTAKGNIATLIEGSRQALQQIPHALPSDLVLIDTEFGITWYLAVQNPVQYYELASGLYFNVHTGPYGSPSGQGLNLEQPAPNVFALPTKDQLDHLRDRLGTIRNDSNGEYSTNTEALTALGFQIPDTSDLKVWMYSPNYPSSDEAETYDFNTGKTDKHKITSESQFFYYFFCMAYPGPAETSSTNPLLANALPGSITVSSESTTQLVATANNSTITSPAGTVTRPADDITADVVWHSSNTNVADISNLGGSQGQITWHPAGIVNGGPSVTFTASFLGVPSGTIVLNPPDIPPADLVAIEVLPTNLLYGMPTPGTPIQELFHATAIYSDQTAVDIDNLATFSVVKTSDGTPLSDPSQAGFSTTTPNLLVINSTLTIPEITVQATYGGVTGSAPIQVSVPNQ